MEANEIRNQINLKQTELNYAADAVKRENIQRELASLKLKLEIEQIKQRIDALNRV